MQEDKNTIYQMRFPQKLWYLLNLRTDAILWGSTGRTILLNYRVLHTYLQCDHSIFKTTNISSFVRQLNLYGFRKVTSHLQDLLCNSKNPHMHEYVHDYFQYGHPELLNNISRKALGIKTNFKPQLTFCNTEHSMFSTPLQKARRALRMALKKAAQDMFMQNPPNKFYTLKFNEQESQDEYCDYEDIVEDWAITDPAPDSILPSTENNNFNDENKNHDAAREWVNYSQSTLGYNNSTDESQQNNNSYPEQFLSMPDLGPDPSQESTTIELLTEFDIKQEVNAGITKKEHEASSLNCVLPSISRDQNDDVSIANRANDVFNSEWDQIFNDLITNKGTSQECASDLKDLYSQISKTIDLLNYS